MSVAKGRAGVAWRWLAVTVGLAAFGLGCGDALGPTMGPEPIRTDAWSYQLSRTSSGYDAEAVAVLVNDGPTDIHYARCNGQSGGPMYGLRREPPDTTRIRIGVAWACVGGVPTGRLAVGDSLSVRVWLGGLNSPNANPPDRIEYFTGTFRIYFELCVRSEQDSADCELVPEERRRSNAFQILPPG